MNFQSTRNTAVRGHLAVKNSAGHRDFSRKAGIAVTFLCFFLGVALILIGYISLCQRSMRCAENSAKLEKQIARVQAGNLHLRNRCAALTGWSHVQRKMQEFGLGLVPASPGQIIRIGIYTPKQAASISLKPLSVASTAPAKSSRAKVRR